MTLRDDPAPGAAFKGSEVEATSEFENEPSSCSKKEALFAVMKGNNHTAPSSFSKSSSSSSSPTAAATSNRPVISNRSFREEMYDEYTVRLQEQQEGDEERQKEQANPSRTKDNNESTKMNCLLRQGWRKCQNQHALHHVARGETRWVKFLRMAVLFLLIVAATMVAIGVNLYTKNEEQVKFETEFQNHALKILESFHEAVERRLGAINTMATALTSYALATNQSFPFVTLPDFAIRGSDSRIQADAMVIHYMPLVWDKDRLLWEQYALENRFQIDTAYNVDVAMRELQDADYGLEENEQIDRMLQGGGEDEPKMSILDDGTGFHTRIWSSGPHTPKGDEAEGIGPYLPMWQRSPINKAKQKLLNWNFAGTFVFHGVLPLLLQTQKAIMHRAARPKNELGRQSLEQNLAISQYRHSIGEFINDPLTFVAYPVFDSFDRDTRQIGGVLATNIHWKIFFQRILPPSAHGIICVLENSYNQTLAYLVDGSDAIFLGEEDPHDPKYDYLEESASINTFVQSQAGPETRSYTTVPLSEEFGRYTLRVYPSRETEEGFESDDPFIYTAVVAGVFFFTSLVFIAFALVVERRQNIVMKTAVKNANKVANTERELNEFLSHELRNPLSAAISACFFVSSAIRGETANKVASDEFKQSLKDDVMVIETSLHFVNDFLRSMLDMHRAAVDRLPFKTAQVDVLADILVPVCSMLYQRNFTFAVTSDCLENLVIVTDALRLKQILLNLGVNASKFVKTGFIRFRAAVVDGLVELYVEDSGPGIPLERRSQLFRKYEDLLGELTQGTGIGLGLSKSLISSLDGDIWLDESYDSGIPGCPGARFVIQLKMEPLPVPPSCIPEDSDATTADATIVDEPTPPDPVLPENLSVLFVDDDTILRKLFSRAVKKVAPTWTIKQAANGESAIRLVEEESSPFDIIFMDQYMPTPGAERTLLGTETIQELRGKGVESRICGLSANNLEDEFLSAGAECFVVKPIPCDKAELESWLLQLLGLR